MSDTSAYALRCFVAESNRIEDIRSIRVGEIKAHERFLAEPVSVSTLKELVAILQPNAMLRDLCGLDVRVGTHTAPPGGPHIERQLLDVLGSNDPFWTHQKYENLHPFTDGNGRSGRALWLHQMIRRDEQFPPLGFLHTWYYQSLDEIRV